MKALKSRITERIHKLDTKHPAIVKEDCCCSGSVTESSCASKTDRIRKKAYELYVSRGCQDGFDLEDWVKAEQLCSEE